MVCDGSTNDGPALQALINLAEATGKPLELQAGTCLIDASTAGLLITSPVKIRGAGIWGTILLLKAGSTTPMFTVNVSTSTFAPGTGQPAEVNFEGFQITSPNRSDAPGQGVAHGLLLINSANHYHSTRVYMHDMMIGGVPGDGIHCGGTQGGGTGGFDGWLEARGSIIQYPGGNGYYANSCTDGRWFGGEIAGAGGTSSGVLLAGTTAMIFDGVNIYINGGHDVLIYQADRTVFSNSNLDLTSYSNIDVNLLSGQRLDVISSIVRWGSTASAGFYGNINIESSNAGSVFLTADSFPTPASSPSVNKPKSNINFLSGAGGSVVVGPTTGFDLGTLSVAGVITGTGTVLGYNAATVGVTCSGSPSASFATSGGIITHC
jgi:hypothetical protein